jgi:glycosyltransferase involved in cell wall biosynthesis
MGDATAMSRHICVLTAVHQPFDGRIFHRECSALAAAGYRVTLVAPADFNRQSQHGVEIIGLPRPRRRVQRPRLWWQLLRQVQQLRPDVVHFHDPELLLLVPLLRLLHGHRLRIVFDVHEYFVDATATKYWIPAWLRPVVTRSVSWLERRFIRGVDGIICVVEEQTSRYAHLQRPLAVVRNLPKATLFEEPHPASVLQTGGFNLIYVGLLLPKRNIDVLLQAMREIHQRGIHDVYLFLIGPETSTAYIQQIQDFIRQHHLDNQVRWLGPIPHEQLKNYLAAAHTGTTPGRYTRQYKNPGLTTKLFEYLLCGLPVISVDYPHRKRYLDESNCGFALPADDVDAHVESILWLRDHSEEAHAMGERGQVMVLDHYTWEQEQVRLLSFYATLLEETL